MTYEEKTVKSTLEFSGPVFKVRSHIVTTQNGSTARRDIVEHSGGVGICAITPQKKLVMIRQYRKAAEAVVWEIPAGKAEEGELPLRTAQRELREETGYDAAQFRSMIKFYGTIGYNDEIIELFRAETTTKGETQFDEHEAIECYELDIPVLVKMIEQGEIIDAKTIIGILLLAQDPELMKDRLNPGVEIGR